MRKFLAGFLFVLLLIISLCGCALAALTVDYGSVTSTAEVIRQLNINPVLNSALLAVIAIMQLLKYFFPTIDKRK